MESNKAVRMTCTDSWLGGWNNKDKMYIKYLPSLQLQLRRSKDVQNVKKDTVGADKFLGSGSKAYLLQSRHDQSDFEECEQCQNLQA